MADVTTRQSAAFTVPALLREAITSAQCPVFTGMDLTARAGGHLSPAPPTSVSLEHAHTVSKNGDKTTKVAVSYIVEKGKLLASRPDRQSYARRRSA
jgi:hypothetical protein